MRTPDIFFLHGDHMPRCTVRMAKRFDDYYTLQFMASGAARLGFDQVTHQLQGSWLWTQYPGPMITLQPGGDVESWDHRYVAFRGPRVNHWIAQQLFPRQPQPMPAGLDYAELFDQLLMVSKRTDPRGNMLATNLLERMLLDLAENRVQQQQTEPWLEKVLGIIERNPSATLNYTELAQQLGVSLSTLRNWFRNATGTSIHNYVLQCRIAEARRLVGESDAGGAGDAGGMPLKAIARKLGYKDVFYFSRQFARYVGTPPGKYRKSRQV